MEVWVFPREYLLHVLDCAGDQMEFWSSRLVRLDATVEVGYSRGRERVFEVHLPVPSRVSAGRPRMATFSEPALLSVEFVRRNKFPEKTESVFVEGSDS